MSEEYTNNKIETKATDSSSGSYAPPIEKVPAKEAPEQEYIMLKVFGLNGSFLKTRKLSAFNTHLQLQQLV